MTTMGIFARTMGIFARFKESREQEAHYSLTHARNGERRTSRPERAAGVRRNSGAGSSCGAAMPYWFVVSQALDTLFFDDDTDCPR